MKQGDIIFEKYRIERKIGSGGMSDVYLVTNTGLGNRWAAKHIRNSSIARTEAEILKKLNHRSLPLIADIFEDHSGTYIIESYIEGVTLQDKINNEEYIEIDTALDWIIQLSEVLSYLHGLKPHPVIYRDLKPLNILVTRDNRIVLVDFGISKVYNQLAGRDRLVAGTNAYAAPEQLIQGGYSDNRSDIYSLGIIMRQLFHTDAAAGSEAGNKVMQQVRSITGRCMEKRPENRFQDVEVLRQELYSLLNQINLGRAKDKLYFKMLIATSAVLSVITYSCTIIGLSVK